MVRLTDGAGNTGTYSLSVRVDTAGPAITTSFSAPPPATGYDGTANISASYSASDISSVASLTAKLDGVSFSGSMVSIYALAAGTHTLVITATDGVGNTSSVTLTFAVHPTLNGVLAAVRYGQGIGTVASAESTKLQGLLNASNPVKTNLTNFINEVRAQSGISISSAEATVLVSWAQDLYNRS
jgi:hypothetical protein